MFERFLAFLRELSGDAAGHAALRPDSPAVAAAAILFHVMDADGVRGDAERAILEREIAETYGVEGADLSAILAAAEAAEADAVDLYGFTSVLSRDVDHAARVDLIEMMWEIVYADGVREEVEDNVVWRVAELLHVERADRVRLRQAVEARRAGGARSDAETD